MEITIRRRVNHSKNLLLDPYPKLVVLLYHRILPSARFDPFDAIVSVKVFEAQLEHLMRRYPIVSLTDAIQQKATPREIRVAITFDDGYEDNYEVAFPILQDKGISATFFVPTDFIGSGNPMWDWEVMVRLCSARRVDEIRVGETLLSRLTGESNVSFAFRVIQQLRAAELPSMYQVLNELRKSDNGRDDPENLGKCMQWEHLRELIKGGMEVGAHAASHRTLALLPRAEAISEIAKSKQTIERQTNCPCKHFAFPFGGKGDYNETLVNAVRSAGFMTCLLGVHGYNRSSQDGFCLKRIVVTENTDLRHLLG